MNNYPAPAKVNLHLAITACLPNGYHTLDTSFVYVDVHDNLTITLSDTLEVTCSETALNGDQNLVFQVLRAFKEAHAVALGLNVYIDKQLPSQAGLGGGSSDAAAALMVANKLWQVNASQDELISFAKYFGADIPCFLFGQASLAVGVGERLTPYLSGIPREFVVLAWPGEGVSTAAAFHQFDKNEFHALTDEKSKAKVRARSDAGNFQLGYNDLERSAISLCAPLKKLLGVMRENAVRAWMSGSGSACVALCKSEDEARMLVDLLNQEALVSWVHVGHFQDMHPLINKIGA